MNKSPLVYAGCLIFTLTLSACSPSYDVEFETLASARAGLDATEFPVWLPADATHIKVKVEKPGTNLFVRFKTKRTDSWLPSNCYRSDFINQLPDEFPSWWPSNATQYRQVDAHYQLYLCKDQNLWWVAVPKQPEFILMWK
jgi:hypothetical protein